MLRRMPLRVDRNIRTLIAIGIAWAVLVIGYQDLSSERIPFKRPDYAVPLWTPQETAFNSQKDKVYLNEPFLNHQVSWDSEFYLSIAVKGYDDPRVRLVTIPHHEPLSMNYAFFPFYPMLMRAVSVPLDVLGKNEIATATLAGVLVAVAGALGGMIALYDLTRGKLGEAGGMRTAFYLLIFPSSFFFAQVYSEGVFAGLAFGSLALIQRRKLWPAALLAALAVWTRSVGVMLVVPLALAWLSPVLLRRELPSGRDLLHGLAVLLPVVSFLVWRQVLGGEFDPVQRYWFGRDILDWEKTRDGWRAAIDLFRSGDTVSQARVYYGLEFASVILALVACLFTARQYPLVALFSLMVLAMSAASGAPQSLIRYVLAVPSLFIFLGKMGRRPLFDRAWITGCLLLMGLLAALFAQDMWVA